MRYLLTLALLTGVGLAAPAQEVPDAAAVVRKAIAAHGGADALKAFGTSASTVKGTMTVPGAELTFTSDLLFAAPDKLRLTLRTEVNGLKLEMVQVMNGDAFAQTSNGKADTIDAAQKAEIRQAVVAQDVATLVPLLTDKYALKASADEKIGGDVANVLTATPTAKGTEARPVTLYFDAKTGYLVRHTRDSLALGGGGTKKVKEDTRLSDFKKFDGVMIPTTAVVTHDGKAFMTMTVTSTKVLKAIDAKEFVVAP